jgi:hypothetical protein
MESLEATSLPWPREAPFQTIHSVSELRKKEFGGMVFHMPNDMNMAELVLARRTG